MTRVTVIRSADGHVCGVEADGHAGSAPKGQDLVCAAVSTLMQTAPEALEQAGINVDYCAGDGFMRVVVDQPSAHARAVLETIVAGLALTARSYPEHVSVEDLIRPARR